jgi:hypothetical protein
MMNQNEIFRLFGCYHNWIICCVLEHPLWDVFLSEPGDYLETDGFITDETDL